MRARTSDLLARGWKSEANLSFFFFLLVLTVFVLPSLGIERNQSPRYADVAFSVALICGAGIAWRERGLFALALLVSIVAIVARWLARWAPSNMHLLWSQATGLVAILMIVAVLLWQVLRSGRVTVMRIQGAIAAYLGLALSWAHAYHIVALLNPGSFSAAGNDLQNLGDWMNYSFGMLTTVGYSGIVPLSPAAHTITSAEAVTGQLYLAVLVARLVSMQVSPTRTDDDNASAAS
jgi:hypothetical protein